jgi:hypothetical protein
VTFQGTSAVGRPRGESHSGCSCTDQERIRCPKKIDIVFVEWLSTPLIATSLGLFVETVTLVPLIFHRIADSI